MNFEQEKGEELQLIKDWNWFKKLFYNVVLIYHQGVARTNIIVDREGIQDLPQLQEFPELFLNSFVFTQIG